MRLAKNSYQEIPARLKHQRKENEQIFNEFLARVIFRFLLPLRLLIKILLDVFIISRKQTSQEEEGNYFPYSYVEQKARTDAYLKVSNLCLRFVFYVFGTK